MANNDNIIYAKFNHGREITTDSRSQYAYGQVLQISGLHLPASFDADVSNKGDKQAVQRIGIDNELPIDDAFFLSGKDIIVMINVHAADKDGRTKYIIRIPVEKRPERTDIEVEPVEQNVISTAIAALNEAVEQTSISEENAENSANYAQQSAINAETSATNASNSETLAQQYMERAETAAENAEQSETKAKISEDNAKISEEHIEQIENNIEQYMGRAETASINAQSSASIATQKATEAFNNANIATTKANEALASATNAQNSANNAQQSAINAQTYMNSASASASKAQVNAEKTQNDKEIVELAKSDVISAVSDAQGYASNAEQSATSASQSATNANVSAQAAEAAKQAIEGIVITTPDWNETDSESYAYINNKPDIKSGTGAYSLLVENSDEYINTASGMFSFANGSKATASGAASIAYGDTVKASGACSTALGAGTKATGWRSIAANVQTQAKGNDSIAVGNGSIADNFNAIATGSMTKANGEQSFTEGVGTIANCNNQHVFGAYNTPDAVNAPVEDRHPIIVGNGMSDNDRSNAFTLDWDGNAYYAGNVTVDGTPTNSKDLVTKEWTEQYVAQEIPEIPVDDVQINGTSIITNGVANIPIANSNDAGVVKINPSFGVGLVNDVLIINGANSNDIKSANNSTKAISTLRQHEATFYGLAKASGDTTQAQSENAVGTYTDEAKTSIQSMLGIDMASLVKESDLEDYAKTDDIITDVRIGNTSIINDGVAEIPIATDSDYGVVKVSGGGLYITSENTLAIKGATSAQVKNGALSSFPLSPSTQHESTFYGLAKAAGDTTQSQSSNAVGTYTDDAKTAIQNMIGIEYPITDIQLDGTSVVNNHVAEIPIATGNDYGVVRISGNGLTYTSAGVLSVRGATTSQVKDGTLSTYPIAPATQHQSVFYGLAKAAGDTTQAQSNNAVGTYTDDAKASIQSMLGVPSEDDVISDVQIDGTSIVNNGVATIPKASDSTGGVARGAIGYGTRNIIGSNGDTIIGIYGVTDAGVKAGDNGLVPLTPLRQHKSVFYGLAKAAGDTTQSVSNNEVGAYTNEAKSAIQSMLGVPSEDDIITDVQINGTSIINDGVANIPVGATSKPGVVGVDSSNGICLTTTGTNNLIINAASTSMIKTGTNSTYPIVSSHAHDTVFFGLAKAAGDTTQSASANAVGEYTESAQSAISDMLNAPVQVSGMDPVIVAKSGIRYICGEVYTLDFTPSATGICDVIFTSGSTPTVLSLPNTVKMPDWFTVEANTTYEINIADGVYGGVMSWI